MRPKLREAISDANDEEVWNLWPRNDLNEVGISRLDTRSVVGVLPAENDPLRIAHFSVSKPFPHTPLRPPYRTSSV